YTRYSNLSCEKTMLADYRIVTNMHTVIQFRSVSYSCFSGYTFIYRTATSYFYAIFNNNTSTTMHFIIAIRIFFVIETMPANHGIARYFNIRANGSVVVNNYVGMNRRSSADTDVFAQHCAGSNLSSRVKYIFDCFIPNLFRTKM